MDRHVMACIVVSLVLLHYVSCLSSVMGLDYSYAEGTPGTNNRVMSDGVLSRGAAGGPGRIPAVGVPIPDGRIIHDVGQTIAGYTADPGGVTGQIDCGAMITQLSAMYRAIENLPEPKKKTKEEKQKTKEDKKAKREPELTPQQLAVRGRNVMREAVIGVAVVDYGLGAGGLHAYLSRSGVGLAAGAGDADAIRLAAARVGAPLAYVNQWNLFSTVVASHNIIQAHRDTHMVMLPHVNGRSEEQDIAAWVLTPGTGQPEGIHFAKSDRTIAKKWPNGPAAWHVETSQRNNFDGGCAMQKLMGNLYGYNGALPPFPDGGVRPFLDPTSQLVGAAAPKLVCAAESAHTSWIQVRHWSGAIDPAYGPGQEVPSCVACQAYIPSVITQMAGSCVLVAPDHGRLAPNCPPILHHTGTCQIECEFTHVRTGDATTCLLGQPTYQTCQPRPTGTSQSSSSSSSSSSSTPTPASSSPTNVRNSLSSTPTPTPGPTPSTSSTSPSSSSVPILSAYTNVFNPLSSRSWPYVETATPPTPVVQSSPSVLSQSPPSPTSSSSSSSSSSQTPPPQAPVVAQPLPPSSTQRSARSSCGGLFSCLSRARFIQRRTAAAAAAAAAARRQERQTPARAAGALEPVAAFFEARAHQVAAPTRRRRLSPARIVTIQQLAESERRMNEFEAEGGYAIEPIGFLESENKEGPNRPPPSPPSPSIPSSTPIPSSPPTSVRNPFSSTPFVPSPPSPTPVPSPSTILLPTPTPPPSSSPPSLRPIVRLGGPSSGPDLFGESRRFGYEEYQRTGKVLGYDINAMVKGWKPPPTPIPIPPSGSVSGSSSSSSSISVGHSSPLSTPVPFPTAP